MSCELFGDSEFSDGRQGVRRGCYEGSFGFVQGVCLLVQGGTISVPGCQGVAQGCWVGIGPDVSTTVHSFCLHYGFASTEGCFRGPKILAEVAFLGYTWPGSRIWPQQAVSRPEVEDVGLRGIPG